MSGRDITEGRSTRAIAVDVGVVASTALWQNTDVSYDVAIGGQPFIYAINDARPYMRQTAPFRKDQFDNGREPGEQSLTGWWIRSQSSFHNGAGIKFFDPTSGEVSTYRFAESRGVDIWTKGQVTLLKNVTSSDHWTTSALQSNGRPHQSLRSIKWNDTSGVLMLDGYDVDKIAVDGTLTHFIQYTPGTTYPVYTVCDDGTTAYWITKIDDAGVTKSAMYKKPLTGSSASTADETQMWKDSSVVASAAVMEFVKERLVLCLNNKVYEMATSATALPTALYTHPSSSHVFTSITASGPAIYVSGYNGIQSTILKFTLSSSGTMPTLTSAVVAAELPVGEIVHKIFYYLGYMLIGTNKGVRVATVSDTDGSLTYGPLLFNTSQPVYDFAARDHFVWATTGIDVEGELEPGVTRIDLAAEIEPLRFAYANDLQYEGIYDHYTTACAFADGLDRLIFTTAANNAGTNITNKQLTSNVATLTTSVAHGLAVGDLVWVEGVDSTFNTTSTLHTVTAVTSTTFSFAKTASNVASTAVSSSAAVVTKPGDIYIEDASNLVSSGFITTGNIRYSTLEPKNFKRLVARGDYTYGTMALESVDADGLEYDHITYSSTVHNVEVTTSQPATAQEYVAYKFVLNRDTTTTSLGPIFKGYQAKATIATPRQRLLRFPVYCFDLETDRYNSLVGYEGRAHDRLTSLEDVEASGDVITWQDLTTGESRQAVIEQITFVRATPPDKRFDGMGGIIEITIRTV